MCIACREHKPKQDLIRVVFTNEDYTEYIIDAKKTNGRGAYICRCRECIDKCIKQRSFNRIYKRNFPDGLYGDLDKVELNG